MRRPVTLRYEDDARVDLKGIVDNGIEPGFQDPEGFAAMLGQRIAGLRDNPGRGRVGRMVGTRELVLPGTPFIVIYTVDATTVSVLRMLHGAMKWPFAKEGAPAQ